MTTFINQDLDTIELARDENYALATIEMEHYKIHEGAHYFVSNFESKDTDEVVRLGIQVPAGTFPHLTCLVHSTSQTEAKFYEGGTLTGGTPVTAINNNRASTNTSNLTLLRDPTVSVSGSLINACSFGAAGATPAAGNSVGFVDRGDELILNDDTEYYMEFTSKDDGNVLSWLSNWYE